jgi:hypothetical protein
MSSSNAMAGSVCQPRYNRVNRIQFGVPLYSPEPSSPSRVSWHVNLGERAAEFLCQSQKSTWFARQNVCCWRRILPIHRQGWCCWKWSKPGFDWPTARTKNNQVDLVYETPASPQKPATSIWSKQILSGGNGHTRTPFCFSSAVTPPPALLP